MILYNAYITFELKSNQIFFRRSCYITILLLNIFRLNRSNCDVTITQYKDKWSPFIHFTSNVIRSKMHITLPSF